MADPYLPPASPISVPSQRYSQPFVDEVLNPSTTSAANRETWPPSIDVNETATDSYVTVEVTKTVDVVTSVDVTISGSFLLYVRGENRGSTPVTWHGVWPAFWFDVYITDTPDADIDGYDGRSALTDPLTVIQHLGRFDGYPGLFGDDDLFVPGPGIAPLNVPIRNTEIEITDAPTIALFEGGSGTKNIYIKARATTPQASEDAGATWGDFGDGDVYIDVSRMRFIGNVVVNVNRT